MSLSLKPRTIAVLSLVLLFSLSVSAFSAKKKKRKAKSFFGEVVTFNASLDIIYDDNIINYSDDDLDLYAGGASESKFAIESKDDWIFTPDIEARIKGKFIGGHTAWLEPSFSYYYYARNDIRRYSKLGLAGRHYFIRSGYVEAEYSFIPDYYYRNEFYRDPAGNDKYIEASFFKHYLKLEVGKDLTPTIKGDVSYRFQHKTFNKAFSERDLTVNGLRLDGIWRPIEWIKFWAYYGLERAEAKGADNPDLNVKDVSYDAWDITFGARYYAQFLRKIRPEFVSTFEYRQIRYQTIKYVDVYRFGREDSNYYFKIGVAGKMPFRIRAEIDYNLAAKRASVEDPAARGLLEYDSNSVSTRLSRGF
jgi:hypothetical protein